MKQVPRTERGSAVEAGAVSYGGGRGGHGGAGGAWRPWAVVVAGAAEIAADRWQSLLVAGCSNLKWSALAWVGRRVQVSR